MNRNENKNEIKKMIIRIAELNLQPDDIKDDESLRDSGIGFDSLVVVALIAELEKGFDIIIDDDEITREIFHSINSIEEFVQLKK